MKARPQDLEKGGSAGPLPRVTPAPHRMGSLPNAEVRQDLKEQIMESVGEDYFELQASCVNKLGPAAGIFVRQLLFWEGKGHDAEGYIYKTEREWLDETGLTRHHQRKARKVLRAKGLMEEESRQARPGGPLVMHFRTDLEAVANLFSDSQDTEATIDSSTSRQVYIPGGAGNYSFLDTEADIGSSTYTESTSIDNVSETTTREFLLQEARIGQNGRSSPSPQDQEKEVEQEEDETTTQPTPISEIASKWAGAEPEEPPRASPSEIDRIKRMLTEERYPTCGVYRRYEQGRLSDQHLLEAVSHELTGSFEEAERFRWSVEECVKLLKEEGIA